MTLSPMSPTRDARSSLPDLLEVLLNRGVLLNLDLLISVADIPLIGISLKAAVAGIETMLEYGMMRDWDAQTRAWVQRSISRDVAFEPGEELLLRMPGEYEEPEPFHTWRPGALYLTDRRLFLFRRDARKILWSTRRDEIESAAIEYDSGISGDALARVRLHLAEQPNVRLIVSRPERLLEILGEAHPRMEQPAVFQGKLWYWEARAGGGVWRGGEGRIEGRRFTWTSPLDTRPALSFALDDVADIASLSARSPVGGNVLQIHFRDGDIARIAAAQPHAWLDVLAPPDKEIADGTRG